MSVSAALGGGLKATRVQHDTEFLLYDVMNKKLALLDQAAELSSKYSHSLFSPDPDDDIYYQNKLFAIHQKEKALDVIKEQLELRLKIVREMKETLLKRAKENAKKSFTIG